MNRFSKSIEVENPEIAKRFIIELIRTDPEKPDVFYPTYDKDLSHIKEYPYHRSLQGFARENEANFKKSFVYGLITACSTLL